MAFELNRAGGIAGSLARGDASGSLPLRGRLQRIGPYALARSLLAACGVVSMSLIVGSAVGLAPLSSPAPSLVALGLGVIAGAWVLTRAEEQTQHVREPVWLSRMGRLALIAGALATACAVALALWLPVGAYDAIGYRLPAVAQWVDAGAWTWVIGDDPLRNGYPLGLELVEAALFAGFASPAAVDAVASLFVTAGALALVGFVQRFASRGAAELAAGLFLLVPMHLLNAPSGYADAAFAGGMVCLAVSVARCSYEDAWLDLGLAAAWVMALKPHGIAYAGLGWALALVRTRNVHGSARAALLASTGLVFALRNIVRESNPLYPVEVRIAGRVILPGRDSLDTILTPAFNVPSELQNVPTWLRPFWVWLQPHGPARTYDDRLAGFGYAFVLLALPAMIYLVLRARDSEATRAWMLVAGLSLACWMLQPLSFWPRFTSWLWGAGAIAIAFTVAWLIDLGRARMAPALVIVSLLLALPEAAYALAHVKMLDKIDPWHSSARETLAHLSEVEPAFVERALVGKLNVCRTPWRIGTDDANLDGVAAQLSPRPRVHVIKNRPLSRALMAARARGCDALIVIGDNPIAERAPPAWAGRIERVKAFGTVSLIPSDLTEVTP